MRTSASLSLALVAGLLSAGAATAQNQVRSEPAQVGDKVAEFDFGPMLNGDGRTKLSEFRGQPILIDFWGTHWGPCIGFAVPQAIEHDLEMRDRGLVVVLPEVQGATLESLPAFLWKTFPKLEARVVRGSGVPIVMGRGIPYSALIGVDGTLLWAGHPSSGGKDRDALIEAELKKVATGWGETPAARKVRAQIYGKQDLAEARKLIDALPEAAAQERADLQQELASAYAWRVRAVQTLRDEARFLEARDAAQALQKSVAGLPEWEAEVTPLLAAFDTPEDRRELTIARRTEALLRAVRAKRMKPPAASPRLRAIAKSGAGTAAGARAEQLANAFDAGG